MLQETNFRFVFHPLANLTNTFLFTSKLAGALANPGVVATTVARHLLSFPSLKYNKSQNLPLI